MATYSARDFLNDLVPTYLFSAGRLDRDLVADFFMLFARAEYALKQAGFCRVGRSEEVVVEWDRFATSLGSPLTQPADGRVKEAVNYLQMSPPRKHIFTNGRLQWKDRQSTSATDPVFLIRSITTVRNNLFHGGKEIVGLMAERDRQLIQNALITLAYCMTLNDDVRRAFGDIGPEGAVASAAEPVNGLHSQK